MDLQNKAIEISMELDWDIGDALQLCLFILEDCNLHTAYKLLDDYRNDLFQKLDSDEEIIENKPNSDPFAKVYELAEKKKAEDHLARLPFLKKQSKMLSEALLALGIIEQPLPVDQDTFAVGDFIFYIQYIGSGNSDHLFMKHKDAPDAGFKGGHRQIGRFSDDTDWEAEAYRVADAIESINQWERKNREFTIEDNSSAINVSMRTTLENIRRNTMEYQSEIQPEDQKEWMLWVIHHIVLSELEKSPKGE